MKLEAATAAESLAAEPEEHSSRANQGGDPRLQLSGRFAAEGGDTVETPPTSMPSTGVISPGGTCKDPQTVKAIRELRDKIQSKLSGGTGWTRRAFRMFDRDASGTVSYSEFTTVLRRFLNLRFPEPIMRNVFDEFDSTGDGEITYKKFNKMVGNTSDETSLNHNAVALHGNYTSADSGNSQPMIRRKIRLVFKQLRNSFRDYADKDGWLSLIDLRAVLSNYDIDLTQHQVQTLAKKLGVSDSKDRIKWADFLLYYRKQEEDEDPNDTRNQLRIVSGLTVDAAVELVREKIQGVLEGGPDGLRRAFHSFDTDRSGGISLEEFKFAMNRKLNLRFEDGLLEQVMKRFDDTGDGQINYRKWCELVMDSTKEQATSLGIGHARVSDHVSADSGNSDMMLRRKLRISCKDLRNAFKDVQNEDGRVPLESVLRIFSRYDIDLAPQQFATLCESTGSSEKDGASWAAIMAYYRDIDDY